jgi:hypothetical protein
VQLLNERYKPSLDADPGLGALLKKAASVYVKRPKGKGGLMDMMMGDEMDDEDDDDDY